MDYQWMKNEDGKMCAIWLREERAATDLALLQQLVYMKFGLTKGLPLVAQLPSAKLSRNTADARGGWYLLFPSPIAPPDELKDHALPGGRVDQPQTNADGDRSRLRWRRILQLVVCACLSMVAWGIESGLDSESIRPGSPAAITLAVCLLLLWGSLVTALWLVFRLLQDVLHVIVSPGWVSPDAGWITEDSDIPATQSQDTKRMTPPRFGDSPPDPWVRGTAHSVAGPISSAFPSLGTIQAQELGVLFDIEGLGSGSYARSAWRVVLSELHPKRVKPCVLFHGDTSKTLLGHANEFCIAFVTNDEATLRHVRETLKSCNARGLVPESRRFIVGDVVRHQGLMRAGVVDSFGEIEATSIDRTYAEDTLWTIKAR